MRITDSCAACLYDKQAHQSDDPAYLAEVRELLDNRKDTDCSPYMVYRFTQIYERRFGKKASYREIKKKYNDLVLSMEDAIRKKIEASSDPLAAALRYARVGNYIDFGAMNQVDEETFLGLLDSAVWSEADEKTLQSLREQCEKASEFLLLCDNCGEIVFDKLLLEQLKKCYPNLTARALVRGEEVLNDATMEDAEYIGLPQVVEVLDNGNAVAGTIYEMMPEEIRAVMDRADVILSKGQGNYESLSGQGRHIFYAFLCKCELFTSRFQVPRLTGIFIEDFGEQK